MTYAARIARVDAHIRDNLAGDLSLDALADVAAFSRFHFHRVYHAATGETVAAAVRRARMNRAAILVAMTSRPIDRIAAEVGYPNPQSFARTFREALGQTPAEVRQTRRIHAALRRPEKGAFAMYAIAIRHEPALRVAALAHQGPYHEIGPAFGRLAQVIGQKGMWGRVGIAVGFYYDSPDETPPQDCRAHVGMVVTGGAVPEGLEEIEVPAMDVAVVTVRGPYSQLPEAWAATYGQLLPASGREPGNHPPYEAYLNSMDSTPPADLLTEIRVPLR